MKCGKWPLPTDNIEQIKFNIERDSLIGKKKETISIFDIDGEKIQQVFSGGTKSENRFPSFLKSMDGYILIIDPDLSKEEKTIWEMNYLSLIRVMNETKGRTHPPIAFVFTKVDNHPEITDVITQIKNNYQILYSQIDPIICRGNGHIQKTEVILGNNGIDHMKGQVEVLEWMLHKLF